jgi:actin-related protein
MDTSSNEIIKPSPKNKRYLIDSMSIKTPRPDMQIRPFLKDGLIDDWNLYENVLHYILGKHLKCDPSKHPILITEPVVNSQIIIFFFFFSFIFNFKITKKKRQTISTNARNCARLCSKNFKHPASIWPRMEFYQRLVYILFKQNRSA